MPARRGSIHAIKVTPREALLFEAGIKLGGIFHQYLGVPVSMGTAPGLARTIERAVSLQPYVRNVHVRVRPGNAGRGRFGYRYLTANMLSVDLEVADASVSVRAQLSYRADLNYPLMRLVSIRHHPKGTPSRRSR